MKDDGRSYIESVPDDEQRDPNGRIVARVVIGSGPSWAEIWRQHVARNWATRFDDDGDDNNSQRRRTPLRRRGF
jgi:hypothetical protein